MNSVARERRNTELVSAAVQENFWAGVGAGAIALCAQLIFRINTMLPLLVTDVFLFSLICMFLMFGLLSVARFSLDEWNDSIERLQMYGLLTEKEAMIVQLRELIAEHQSEIKRLRREVRASEFMSAAKDARNVVVADESAEDRNLRNAERILERWAANLAYSRDNSDMPRSEWEAAMSLLQAAGLAGRGGAGGKQMVIEAQSFPSALSQLRSKGRMRASVENTNFVAA